MQMKQTSPAALLTTVLNVLALIVIIWLIVLVIRALRRYLRAGHVREETAVVRQTLGERIKTCRTDKRMTQEFVAEALGVSRQAVSKWESGASAPGTQNLIALAQLFEIPPEALLKDIDKKA